MNLVENTGNIAPEPHWRMLLTDDLEVEAATEYWRRITTEMKERSTLSSTNAHAIQRLVLSYITYDRCSREVAENGAVTKPKRGSSRAIARVSPHYTAMREAGSDAASLEAELGLSPRRRSTAGKVDKQQRRARPADDYLKPANG